MSGETVNALLGRLDKVRSNGGNAWRANCPNPVHSKAKDTLSISEGDTGLLLLNCFACHDTPSILAAVGMELADLYPKRLDLVTPQRRREAREHFKLKSFRTAGDVIKREALICAIACSQIVQGHGVTGADVERVALAERTIHQAVEAFA